MRAFDEARSATPDHDGILTSGTRMALRVVRFRPLHIAFDQILRDTILRDLARHPGVVDVLAGRKGPDETGPRVIVSLWLPAGPLADGSGDDPERLRSEHRDATTDHEVEVRPVLLSVGERGSLETGILRIARGDLDSLPVTDYAEDVRQGIESDRNGGHGPVSLVLGETGKSSFVTVSRWRAWSDLARATGASMDRPIHTQRMEDVRNLSVEHLELLPATGS